MPRIRKAFKRLHYPIKVIAQCVRWYLAYSLSLRNLEEMMAEQGVIDHSTLHRWVTLDALHIGRPGQKLRLCLSAENMAMPG